jgi:hypothetical protein
MSELPPEVEGRFGAFRSAWRMEVLNGFITRERVVGFDWYIFWLQLEGRWECLPFRTLEAGSNEQLPLVGGVEFIAAAIGRTRKLYLVVDWESIGNGEEIWWWKIYWRRRGRMYLLVTVRTDDPFLMVV